MEIHTKIGFLLILVLTPSSKRVRSSPNCVLIQYLSRKDVSKRDGKMTFFIIVILIGKLEESADLERNKKRMSSPLAEKGTLGRSILVIGVENKFLAL